MRYLQNFNESLKKSNKIWCLIVADPDSQIGSNSRYVCCHCFTSEMLAADYFIRLINDVYEEEFESFFDDNGDRYFSDIIENEDYERCLEYCLENQIKVDIIETNINPSPI